MVVFISLMSKSAMVCFIQLCEQRGKGTKRARRSVSLVLMMMLLLLLLLAKKNSLARSRHKEDPLSRSGCPISLYLLGIITFREVLSGMSASGLLSSLGCVHGHCGIGQKVSQLQGFDQIGVPHQGTVGDLDVLPCTQDLRMYVCMYVCVYREKRNARIDRERT